MNQASSRHSAPPRLERPSPIAFILLLAFAAFFISGFSSANIHSDRLLRGVMNLGTFFGEALPPDFGRWDVIAMAMLETFQMAIVGVVFGVILSLPMALLCARNTSPHPVVRVIARNVVATLRTVPDLVWALIFVVAVVLGLVGAGGIGVELSAAMSLFRYDQALTVILAILVVVIGVEQVSAWIRKRVI
ncbi:ABC transporter permease [Halomonas sp. A11-A]|uniref:PhnE/PtxC family ABC transporter permease n=1 Tax=Halomonas sp. A11-A TaxID=2183985 RepID=UPI000D71BA6E|nr:hypothetical protein [Halomonas sp. A11-A]PWV81553.1 hypothetical protein DER72_10212 [Halomonas sp. A11-A]